MSERHQQGVVTSYPQGDTRPILLRPCRTDEIRSDKADILDMVRKRIKERKLKPNDIRKGGVTKWSPLAQWRLTEGYYDDGISIERAYQLATVVGLRRTQTLPFAL